MGRIDVHNHFLPGLDDGCRDLGESLVCLRMLVEHGYTRTFCTPHMAISDPWSRDLSVSEVAAAVESLRQTIGEAGVPIEIRPGGELRLRADMCEILRETGIPTYGHAGKYVVADLWEHAWPAWATRAVEWLAKQGLTVILAHPERLPYLRKDPSKIEELARIGLLFQGNLGPIAGADQPEIVALAERFLQDGRYWMVGTDGHRPGHLAQRLAGLGRIEQLVGKEKLIELTETHPGELWT